MREVALFFAWFPPGVDSLGECVPPPFYTSGVLREYRSAGAGFSPAEAPRALVMACAPGWDAMSFLTELCTLQHCVQGRIPRGLPLSADRPTTSLGTIPG